VDHIPDPLLLRKSGVAGNRTLNSGSVARTLTTRPQRRSLYLIYLLFILMDLISLISEF
jgi:NADH:ubiquinone oxidoreductase subunit 3 (subunit A)